MIINHYRRLILALMIFIIGVGVLSMIFRPNIDSALFNNGENLKFISSNFYELREFIEESVSQAKESHQDKYQDKFKNQFVQIGITSHHLPVAVSLISDLYIFLSQSQGPRDVFVILGPDHFEQGYTSVSTTLYPFSTPFGELEVEDNIVKELIKAGVNIDNEALIDEHSIGIQTIFIKLFFPKSQIVPLVFRADTDEKIIDKISEVLTRYKDKITVIASVDFSHYQSYENAQALDAESKKMLSDFNFDSFTLEYVDSPSSLKLIGELINSFEANGLSILEKANSYNFTGSITNTTGYINALFSKKSPDDSQTLMFVGDVMLSRSVGEKMKKENNWQWPFLEIADYFKKADLLFGNLEGPISDKGEKVGSVYSFRADPRVVEGLKYAGFNILSVANNHMGDWGREAMEDTFKILKENDISYTGGGYNKEEAHSPIVKKLDNGAKIAFLAYTNLGSKHWEAEKNQSGIAWLEERQIEKDIKEAETKADVIVISMHFGEEYSAYSNQSQQIFAHSAIEAGADLVIGHHSHVVQEIEKYKDGYIVYSLGNFVFDQNFSLETKRGWILNVIVEDDKIKEVTPIEIEISNDFQPFLKDKTLLENV